MTKEQRREVVKNADRIMGRTLDELDSKTQKLDNIQYYDKFEFIGSGLEERGVYITKIDGKENVVTRKNEAKEIENLEQERVQEYSIYKIYDKDQNLIATADREGNLTFTPEYVENLKAKMPKLYRMLQLNGLKLQLPKELGDNDLVLTKEDIEKEKEKPCLSIA